jgi:hypothetical protein
MVRIMSERRQTSRQKSFLRGRVIFNKGRFSLDCMVRDLSNLGARIIFADNVNVPDIVDLHIPQRNKTARALVTWRHGDEIGIAFSEEDRVISPASVDDDLVKRVSQLEAEIVVLQRSLKRVTNKIKSHPDAA